MVKVQYGVVGLVLVLAMSMPSSAQDHSDKDATPALAKAEFLKQAEDRFSKLDTDYNGELSKDEIQAKNTARQKKKNREFFKRVDRDHNGYISMDEYQLESEKLVEEQRKRSTERGEKWFDDADGDGNGYLSREEYLAKRNNPSSMRHFTTDYMKKNFKRLDIDEDGIISESEYIDKKGRYGQTRDTKRSSDTLDFLPPNSSRKKVKRQDANKDKKITRFENDRFQDSIFEYFDADNDGELSAKERNAMKRIRYMDKTL